CTASTASTSCSPGGRSSATHATGCPSRACSSAVPAPTREERSPGAPARTPPARSFAAAPGSIEGMCRSIKTLRREDEPATQDEIEAAARQFVRKVSAYRQTSKRNAEAFEDAMRE